jgi:hypothetical protein
MFTILFFARAIGRSEGTATREKIKEISEGIDEAQQRSGVIVCYKDDSLEIIPSNDAQQTSSRSLTLKDRAISRLEFLAEKQQHNIEMIAGHAASLLQDKDSVPADKPDEDWISPTSCSAASVSFEQPSWCECTLMRRCFGGNTEHRPPNIASLPTRTLSRRRGYHRLVSKVSNFREIGPRKGFLVFWEFSPALARRSAPRLDLRGRRDPELTGLEPATSAVTGRRSNQLSYNSSKTSGETRAEYQELQPNSWAAGQQSQTANGPAAARVDMRYGLPGKARRGAPAGRDC